MTLTFVPCDIAVTGVIEVRSGGVDGEPDGDVLARLDGLLLGS